mmetsp:Transcript_27372/g.57513  ORF Transcript_27372/g.57513 Transcript_27372/m.57513 type:complete len:142 (-) Transcript_27372:200-625(-)
MTSSRSRAMFSRWHRAKLLPGGRGAVQAFASGRKPLATGPQLPIVPIILASSFGACIVAFDYFNRQKTPYEKMLQKKEEEWREHLAELKEYYAKDPEKQDPPHGTALGHFVRVNRNSRLLPAGLPDWKVRELEAVDGWRWE